ncbi:MAG TPA: 16S rRNA (adenine(1518)-N(6)/adenine(1519)-N(6))-dimethyltransferase RsmA [Chloroflexota bacterium]|nr:16S rRNA (adenine(1518)-N(6)/adenine(1519)-N(6))-dimethyltransferase RsmA [Chloroflexota bacterium]
MTKERAGRGRVPAKTGGDLPPAEELWRLTPKALLRTLGLSARKGLSQSFLTDSYVVRDILAAAELVPEDDVLEVGPGLGVMTRELVKAVRRVVAVELDQKLAELLPTLVPAPERLEVVNADILEFDVGPAFSGPYKVVANLPYHISSPLLRKLLTSKKKPTLLVVMVQKEVAERMVAKPGNTSLLTIMVQLYSQASLVRDVPAAAFFPAPQVDSAVVKLEVYEQLPHGVDDPEAVLKIVAAGFSRRRKQLHNALSDSLWFPSEGVYQVLAQAGIDPARRAQTLSVEEWVKLYRSYEEARRGWQEKTE